MRVRDNETRRASEGGGGCRGRDRWREGQVEGEKEGEEPE